MAAEREDYESVLCVKPAVLVYRVPPRASNRGYRAAEWQLDQPAWRGRLRVTARGDGAFIRLEDGTSGELFAQAPVEQFPGMAVEGVTDSSRYFVIRVEDGNGRRAFLGLGFMDRGDAFDFNVALQDHFKWVRQQNQLAQQDTEPGTKLDLSLKEGQTMTLHINNMKRKEGSTGNAGASGNAGIPGNAGAPGSAGIPGNPGIPGNSRPCPGGLRLLPPPPGGKSSSGERRFPGTPITDSLLSWPVPASAPAPQPWGDFAKASGSDPAPSQGWVQF